MYRCGIVIWCGSYLLWISLYLQCQQCNINIQKKKWNLDRAVELDKHLWRGIENLLKIYVSVSLVFTTYSVYIL